MRLYVPLKNSEAEALKALARAERRRPQDQAAVLLAQALRLGDVGSQSANGDNRLSGDEIPDAAIHDQSVGTS